MWYAGVLDFPIHVSIRLLTSVLDVTVGFNYFYKNAVCSSDLLPASCKKLYREWNNEYLILQGSMWYAGVLDVPIHVSIHLLTSALDVTGGFNYFKNFMSVRVIFCLPLAKNCIENGLTGI